MERIRGASTRQIDTGHTDRAVASDALPKPMTFEEAQRRAIFHDDDGKWHHRFMNMILCKLYKPGD